MGKHVLKIQTFASHLESSRDTPFLIFTRRKNVIDLDRERQKGNQLKELFNGNIFLHNTTLCTLDDASRVDM